MKEKKRSVPRPFKMPWGEGEIIEEASCCTEWHEPAIQLMKYDDGSMAIRFAHYRHGGFQRSPLIISARDLQKLKASIARNPQLKKLLKALL